MILLDTPEAGIAATKSNARYDTARYTNVIVVASWLAGWLTRGMFISDNPL